MKMTPRGGCTFWAGATVAALISAVSAVIVLALSLVASAGQGIASHYGAGTGRPACGGSFSAGAMTAAHRSLPCGTKVHVTNVRNGRSVVVRITDRGPFIRGRIIDVTTGAAGRLGFRGLAPVRIKVVR